MPIEFLVRDHDILPGRQVVEVQLDGTQVAVIFPEGEKGIKIISPHIDEGYGVIEDDGTGDEPQIPHIALRFNPRRYHFEDGKLVRET